MLIGIDASHAVKENRTGVEEACWQIIENLKNTLSADTKVILYSHKMPVDKLAQLPVNWEWKILSWPFKKMWTQGALARELIKNPPDVYFSPGQLLPWYVPKKSFVFVHDSAFLFFPEAYNFWGRQYLRAMNWWITRRAYGIITSTEFNRNELNSYYGKKIDKKIFIAPLAFDHDRYNESIPFFSAAELAEKFNIKKPFTLFVGRLEKKKNVKSLIEAFELARQQQDFQLVLSGRPGSGYEDIKQALSDSPYKDDILILGWVDNKDLSRLVRTASVLSFPSYYEGFGIPVLEAMASGTPVICSAIPALQEVAGEAVWYASPHNKEEWADGLVKIFSSSQYGLDLRAAGHDRSAVFSWQKTAQAIAKILGF